MQGSKIHTNDFKLKIHCIMLTNIFRYVVSSKTWYVTP